MNLWVFPLFPAFLLKFLILRASVNDMYTAFGALTFGYDAAFIGTTITRPGFTAAFGIDEMTASEKINNSANLTSSFTAACFFGAVFAWPSE